MDCEGRSDWLLCNQSPVTGGHDMGSVGSWGGVERGTAELEEKSGQQTCESCLTMPCNARNKDFKSLEKRNWNKKQVCLQRSPAWMLGNFKKQSVSKHFTDKRPHHRWRQLVSVFILYIVKHCLHVWIKMKRGESCPGQARWMWRLGTRGVNIQLSSSRAASHGTCGLLPADLSCCYIHI